MSVPPSAGAPVVVDARGLRCPLPVIRLAARAKELPAGTVVTVLATDPAARHDVPAWARLRGHTAAGEERVEAGEPDDAGSADDPDRPAAYWSLTVRLGDG